MIKDNYPVFLGALFKFNIIYRSSSSSRGEYIGSIGKCTSSYIWYNSLFGKYLRILWKFQLALLLFWLNIVCIVWEWVGGREAIYLWRVVSGKHLKFSILTTIQQVAALFITLKKEKLVLFASAFYSRYFCFKLFYCSAAAWAALVIYL